MKKFSQEDFDYRFNRAKKEILEDIENGMLPNNINYFDDLDLYTDMNHYSGFCEEEYEHSENFEFENKVQNAVNEWLETIKQFCNSYEI